MFPGFRGGEGRAVCGHGDAKASVLALKAQSPDNEPWRAMLGARGKVRSWGECEAGSEAVCGRYSRRWIDTAGRRRWAGNMSRDMARGRLAGLCPQKLAGEIGAARSYASPPLLAGEF
ncbi:hypothetical protein RR42_s1301 [Cupriavidus basilensis]|uniref:Uncharacterized protein n=1 Tax=Cupriavidus basilensis TaxID=68895 RepID=A0A0C4YLJ0_9BURK|nr:hypothetical protein RR42_s1301 [Cupriavidus basilensis]